MKRDRDKPMTVANLMRELQKLDPNLPVLVRGYEGGAHDVGRVTVVKAKRNHNDTSYIGPHEVEQHHYGAMFEGSVLHVFLQGYGNY